MTSVPPSEGTTLEAEHHRGKDQAPTERSQLGLTETFPITANDGACPLGFHHCLLGQGSVPPGQVERGGLALWVGRLAVLGDQGQRRGRPESDFGRTETAAFPLANHSVPRLCRGVDTMPPTGQW